MSLRIHFSDDGVECSVAIANALLTFASCDETRFHMCGIGIDDKGRMAATDGHTLCLFTAGAPTAYQRYHQMVWSREYVTVQIAIAKASKSHVRLAWGQLMSGAQFPPGSKVMPAEGISLTESIGFNPDYFARMAPVEKACRALKSRVSLGAKLVSAAGPMDPMMFRISGDATALVVIMPMRI